MLGLGWIFLEVLIRKKRLHVDEEIKFVDGKSTTIIPQGSEVTVDQSAMGAILGFGNVNIKTADKEIVLNMFNWPKKIEKLLKR